MACLLLLTGCASWWEEAAPPGVKEATAEAPCSPSKVPPRPAFPADSLVGGEDIWVLGITLWADRKERRAYELTLETVLKGCTEKTP